MNDLFLDEIVQPDSRVSNSSRSARRAERAERDRKRRCRRRRNLTALVIVLLVLGGGGYAVEAVEADGSRRYLTVHVGMAADGFVEISGDSIPEGQRVVVAE